MTSNDGFPQLILGVQCASGACVLASVTLVFYEVSWHFVDEGFVSEFGLYLICLVDLKSKMSL